MRTTVIALCACLSAGPLAAAEAPPDSAAETAPARDRARTLFFQASEAMLTGAHREAAELFDASHAAHPSPTSLLGAARALAQAGALRAALDRYQKAAVFILGPDPSEAFVRSVAAARRERPKLAARIPRVVIMLDEAPRARVDLDGTPIARDRVGREIAVDPGTIVVTARAKGYRPFQTSVLVTERSVVPIHVTLAPERQPRISIVDPGPSAQSITGYALIGVGVTGVLAWGISGALFLHDKSIVEEECNAAGVCDSQRGVDAAERAKVMGIVNAAALIGGLATAGVGITLVLTSGEDAPRELAEVVVGPAGVSIGGAF